MSSIRKHSFCRPTIPAPVIYWGETGDIPAIIPKFALSRGVEKTARDEIFRSVRVNRPLSRHARSLLSGRAPLCYTSPPINPPAGEPQ